MNSATRNTIHHATQSIFDAISSEETIAFIDETVSDRAISTLEWRVHCLKIALEVIQVSFSRRIVEKKRARNAHSPIGRLPLELLITIFINTLETEPIVQHFSRLQDLVRVSHRWDNAIRQTASLWPYIATPYPIQLTNKAIARSKAYPLTINLRCRDFWPTFRSNLKAAAEHVQRWGRVTLEIQSADEIGHTLETPAPLITHLELISHDPTSTIDLFKGQANRLRHLSLTRVLIPFSSPILSGLHHLELADIPWGPSTTDLTKIFAASPELRVLKLEQVGGACFPVPDEPVVIMSQLESLHLVSLHPQYCVSLLSEIDTPNCTTIVFVMAVGVQVGEFDFAASDGPSTIAFLDDTLGRLIEPIKYVLAQDEVVGFNLGDAVFGVEQNYRPADLDSDTHRTLHLELYGVAPVEAFRWFLEKTASRSVETPSRVFVEGSLAFSEPGLLSTLARLGRVTAIRVEAGIRNVDELVDFLTQPYFGVDGIKRWRLPLLRELTLPPTRGDWDKLLQMIVIRHAPSSIGTQKPVRFKVLDFGFWPDSQEATCLQRFVDEGVLRLQPPVPALQASHLPPPATHGTNIWGGMPAIPHWGEAPFPW